MNVTLLDQMTRTDPTLLVIEGGADGLYYVASPKNPSQLAILGAKGATIVNKDQVLAIAKEIVEIYDQYHGKQGIPYGEEIRKSERLREWHDRQRDLLRDL